MRKATIKMRENWDRRLREQGGFLLPVVLVAMVVLAVIVTVAMRTGSDEFKANRAMALSAEAFYAADGGAREIWGRWADTLIAGMAPGDTVLIPYHAMGSAAGYRAAIMRLDNEDDGDPFSQTYALAVLGRSRRGESESRVFLVMQRAVVDIISAAVKGDTGFAKVENNSVVDGNDMIPTGMESICKFTKQAKPGVQWTDPVTVEAPATISGDPPIETIPDTDLFDWGVLDYDDLAALADYTFPDPTVLSDAVGPLFTGGLCDVAIPTNWGEPLNSGSACFEHYPIIHALGDLKLEGTNQPGQGILLVDGDLHIENDFLFHGIMIVKGDVKFENNVELVGGLIIGGQTKLETWTGSVRYSACVVDRTLLGRNIIKTRPIFDRAWLETF